MMANPTNEHREQARASNRLEEIRARWRRTDLPLTVYSGHVQGDIETLLQLLDARPAVAADARELAWEIARIVLGFNDLDDLIDLPPESGNRKFIEIEIAQRITTYANQRVEQAWREGVEAAAKVADVCSCGSGPEFRAVNMRHHALNCSTYLATMIRALLNQPGEKS